MRKEAEGRDSLSHFLGSGTCSGMGTLLFSKVRREPRPHYGDFFHSPVTEGTGTVVQLYYAVLSFPSARRNRCTCMLLDIEGLYDICFHTLKLTTLTNGNQNYFVSVSITGAINSPFPRLWRYFKVSVATATPLCLFASRVFFFKWFVT